MTDISLPYPGVGASTTAPNPPSGGASPLPISWQQPSGIFGFSLWTALLKVITLGIYGFWAKSELRRRIWAAIRFDGEPLRYTGTGGELFKGFLIAMVAIVLPLVLTYAVLIVMIPRESPLLGVVMTAFYAIFFFLFGLAAYRATRYRLSRTLWRGIRAGLDGSPFAYAVTWFWTGLLIPLTLGWIVPWRATKLQSLLVNNIRFGQTHVGFSASARPLYGRFAGVWIAGVAIIAVVGSIVYTAIMSNPANVFSEDGMPVELSGAARNTIAVASVTAYLLLGIVIAWYQTFKMRHFANHTSFAGATFQSTVTTAGVIWLVLSNMIIAGVTLGILLPIAQVRSARYFIEQLSLNGAVDVGSVIQGAKDIATTGEGLAQAFDIDAF